MDPARLLALALGAVTVALLVALVRAGLVGGGADLLIRYRPGRPTTISGRVPASKRPGIRAFFDRELRPAASATVRGTFGPGRSLRVRIGGELTPGERQRVRNFLAEHLR